MSPASVGIRKRSSGVAAARLLPHIAQRTQTGKDAVKIGGEYDFDGPQDVVWSMLLDPSVLARILPGAEKLDKVGDNEFEGLLKIKVGPVQGDFQGKVRLEDLDPPNGYTMQVDGRGAPGFVKATGKLKLSAQGERTHMVYDADAQVGGKLAAVGQRLVDSAARAIIGQSLDGLNAAVKATVAARAAATASGATTPPAEITFPKPTQAQFAATVAKEVARDVLPSVARRGLVALIIIAVLVVIWMLVR
jgi:carbon monoxide dehydrogenase subunit G